jgi:hypothetical protein
MGHGFHSFYFKRLPEVRRLTRMGSTSSPSPPAPGFPFDGRLNLRDHAVGAAQDRHGGLFAVATALKGLVMSGVEHGVISWDFVGISWDDMVLVMLFDVAQG